MTLQKYKLGSAQESVCAAHRVLEILTDYSD